MPRFLVFMLLLLVSVATLTPCCRFDNCAAQHASARPERKDPCAGSCSPFFACATCPGFVSTAKQLQLPAPPLPLPLRHAAREQSERPQFWARSFWQPPRA